MNQDQFAELQKKWQALVAIELKTDNPSLEKTIGLKLMAPILSVQSQPRGSTHFATAPLSQSLVRSEDFSWESFQTAFELGVFDFILDPFLLGWTKQECMDFVSKNQLQAQAFKGRIWGLGDLAGLGTKVIHAQELTRLGAHGIHEIGFLLYQVIAWAQASEKPLEIALALEMETDFFKSIAKKRALSSMIESALETLNKRNLFSSIKFMGRAPWKSFTSLDCHSNILRNATALAAAYLSGCDVVESLPYDLLVTLEESQRIQAKRLGLTSQLVLQSESHLSEITDPAYGSYTIENLTEIYIEHAWSFMQSLENAPLNEAKCKELALMNWEEITTQFNKRRRVQTGVNDFALADNVVAIHPRWLKRDHVRLGREFEELRFNLKTKIHVNVAVIGNYASLQARANFTKNYFELLGLKVHEQVFDSLSEARDWMSKASVSAWVTSDEIHSQCSSASKRTYIAGKTAVDGCLNLFSGQDVYKELSALVQWIEAGDK